MEECLVQTPITANPRRDGTQRSKVRTAAHPEALTEMPQDLIHQCSQTVQQGRETGQLERTLQTGGLRQKRMASILLEGAE